MFYKGFSSLFIVEIKYKNNSINFEMNNSIYFVSEYLSNFSVFIYKFTGFYCSTFSANFGNI